MEPTKPITRLADLEVILNRTPVGIVYVELVDPRCGLRLASLSPRDASALAGHLVAAAGRAGWYSSRGDPGE